MTWRPWSRIWRNTDALMGGVFGLAQEDILRENFFLLEPNTQNPYRQLYCYS